MNLSFLFSSGWICFFLMNKMHRKDNSESDKTTPTHHLCPSHDLKLKLFTVIILCIWIEHNMVISSFFPPTMAGYFPDIINLHKSQWSYCNCFFEFNRCHTVRHHHGISGTYGHLWLCRRNGDVNPLADGIARYVDSCEYLFLFYRFIISSSLASETAS